MDLKTKNKLYYEKYREERNEYQRNYYQKNKETILAKKYYHDNKEHIKALARKYYHKHKYDPTYSHYLPHRLELQRKVYKEKNPYSKEYYTQGKLLIDKINGNFYSKINRGEYIIDFS